MATPPISSYSKLLISPSPLFHPPPRLQVSTFLPPLAATTSTSSSTPITGGGGECYNGWADLDLDLAASTSASTGGGGHFLPGFTGGRYGLLFLLGFLSALSLSRIRVPPLALLPVSALLFAAGFAAGTAKQGIGRSDEISSFGEFTVSDERLRDLRAVLSDLDGKIGALKDGLVGISGSDRSQRVKIRDFAENVEYVRIKLRAATKLIENNVNQKSSSKSAAIGDVVSDLGKYLSRLIRENLAELSSPQKKAAANKEKLAENVAVESLKSYKVEQPVLLSANFDVDSAAADNVKDVKEAPVPRVQDDIDDKKFSSSRKEVPLPRIRNDMDEKRLSSSRDGRYDLDMLSYDEEINNLDARLHVMRKQGSLDRLVFKRKCGRNLQNNTADPFEDSDDSPVADGRRESMDFFSESNESSLLERTLEIRNRSYKLKIEHMGDKELDEGKVKAEVEFAENPTSFSPTGDGGISSSTETSDGEEFHGSMKEASELLMKAREFMVTKANEETADALLYKSARLFSTAVALKPTSLLAVGQLGNTYLLHGELKLKISRELRTLLLNSEPYLSGREHGLRFRKFGKRIIDRENVSSALVDVCEECESLLVEAGRSYRMALSIDSGDLKALYNWGLALTFRAQLIADIGPEAAVDADKVYLAAIDKFDAMLSKSNTYAPEALYRWGIALQQRSHLRPRNNKEKIRLLEQAKCMFEDVLYVEADNKIVREALSLCISELNYHGRWL